MLTLIREMLGGQIEVGFRATTQAGHYVQSPYNYTPKLGRRLIRSTYIDLGLGLLDCLQELDRTLQQTDMKQKGANEAPTSRGLTP
jgi:UDP-glucose 4-epimerase